MASIPGFVPLKAAFWSLTWAVGAAAGVALGAWLTVAGQAGVPGAELDPGSDLFVIPAIVFAVVFIVHFDAQLFAALLRARRTARRLNND